jgi:hypothetical protein
MLWQLDELKNKKITGLQINYCHTDAGGATYGLTFPSQPALFSQKWWELFNWFLKELIRELMFVNFYCSILANTFIKGLIYQVAFKIGVWTIVFVILLGEFSQLSFTLNSRCV